MIYGYARISTAKQSIERQIRNIKQNYPDAMIFTEAFTGTKIERPEWCKLMGALKNGDTVVFDSVSRMSRNSDDGFAVYEKLFGQGIELVFLKEPHINTETYKKAKNESVPLTGTAVDKILEGVNQYLLELAKEQIRIAFDQAEKEVQDLHQRTREGIITARLNGKKIGHSVGTHLITKKSISAKEIIRQYNVDFGGMLSDSDCIKLIGISRNSYYKYKSELKN